MIDHSINLYFQINLFHNVAAPMSFHFLCFSPLVPCAVVSFVYALFIRYVLLKRSTTSAKENMAEGIKENWVDG